MSYIPIKSSGNITLTSAQIKALRSTPIEIIAAPAAGYAVSVITATVKFNYGGSDVFVTGGNLEFRATSNTGLLFLPINSAIYTGSVDNLYAIGSVTAVGATTINTLEAQNVILTTASADPTGNASNDNTLVVNILYTLLKM